jgi:ElaB/YqjD/DUF883 family membrane-anchored ribosome-binding protein
MKTNTKSHFETPTALSHDAGTLVDDARELLEATSEIADEKVTAARQRLSDAIEAGKESYEQIQQKVVRGAKAADQTVRSHPYESMAVALGVGLIIGFLVSRRN